MRVGCILLAAGSGRRFGGDKLAYRVDGTPMAARACMLHSALPYAQRVLVARPYDAFVHDCAKQYGFALAVNERHAQGIGTSAAVGMAALSALDGALDGALFAVCDQPYLTAEVVEALLERFEQGNGRIVAPMFAGKRGNPVLFPHSVFSEFASLAGDVGGGAVIRQHPELLTLVPIRCARALADVDTRPETL